MDKIAGLSKTRKLCNRQNELYALWKNGKTIIFDIAVIFIDYYKNPQTRMNTVKNREAPYLRDFPVW